MPSNPYLFQGTVGDNLLMSLRSSPRPCCGTENDRPRGDRNAAIGQSLDSTKADCWIRGWPNLNTRLDIYDLVYQLVSAVGTQDVMFRAIACRTDDI